VDADRMQRVASNRHAAPSDSRDGRALAQGHGTRHHGERPVTHSCCRRGMRGLGARGWVPVKLGWSGGDVFTELLSERVERGCCKVDQRCGAAMGEL
jgi:hypothetical protein